MFYDSWKMSECYWHVLWSDQPSAQVERIFLSDSAQAPEDLQKFPFKAWPLQKDQLVLNQSRCTEFQWKVLQSLREIPKGQVKTYAELGDQFGPAYGRAVGNALARNPFPGYFPCHRIVRSDGSLGGFTCEGMTKQILLEREGVAVQEEKVSFGQFV